MELDLEGVKKMSKAYSTAKEQAINEAGKTVDIQNIKHIAENKMPFEDEIEKVVEDWNTQKEVFHQQTGFNQHSSEIGNEVVCYQPDGFDQSDPNEEESDDFEKELELMLT
ncbi:hypothetical protein AQUCO_03300057v1 [Aquilegia coerulea]|uniref:Uncharacterized protein n=1 Tax=Aquilegia coerulea TaxID=218851 RepID=A0A2G5CZB6_AQUCA|nr:hypothetical protein AQUCO_03300057v1 [Aquilegia coerulea]